jgi:protein phosphatase 1L
MHAPTALHESDVLRNPKHIYWGIYDGHCGHFVSVALEQNFYRKLNEGGAFEEGLSEDELRQRVRKTYLDTDNKICEILSGQKTRKKRKPGSCCTAVWMVGTRLVVSHVGDSRVVLVNSRGVAEELAPDHHPDAPTEKARIEERGGVITYRGCWRVYSPEEGFYLAVSRAFGDICLKMPKQVIDADPDITVREITPDDKWLIIASDGLWCRVENDQAAACIRTSSSAQEATERLILEAKLRNTHDNTTVIVVKLDRGRTNF